MVKKFLARSLSFVLAGIMTFSSITPAFALDDFAEIVIDNNLNITDSSEEQVIYQDTDDSDFTNNVSVIAQIKSSYYVTIPKVIVLSGVTKQGHYKVSVRGDIAAYETIYVVPESTVDLYSNNKAMHTGTITQDKDTWTYSTLDTDANGLVEALDLDAGSWSGIFWFNISFDKILGDVIDPEHTCTKWKLIESENATCLKESTEVYECKECHQTKTEHATAALGHDWDDGVITVEPKCLTTGIKLFTCQRCGETREDIIPALGHDYVEGVCTRCGDELPLLEYTAEGYEGMYDEQFHHITVVLAGNTITYSVNGTDYDSVNPEYKNVGTYTVYYKITKPTYKTLTGSKQVIITKAKSVASVVPTAKDLTFNDSLQELINAGETSTGTIYYKLNDGEYDTVIPSATDAGNYTVYYKIVGDSNHEDVEETAIPVEIKKADGNITVPTAKDLTFNGSKQELINEGSSTTGTIMYKLDNGTYSESIPAATDAGTYTVYYKVVSTDNNYNDVKEASFTVTIKKANSDITEPTIKDLTYTGQAQELVNPGSTTTGQIQYKLGENGTYSTDVPKATNAGKYVVYYKVVGDKNHENIAEKSLNVEIKKADSILTAPVGKIMVHTGSALELVTPGTTTTGTIYYKLNNGEYSEDIPKATEKDTYTVYYKVVGDTNHNDIAEASVTAKIGDYAPPTAKDLTYNESAQELVNPGQTVAGKMVYRLNNTSYSETIPSVTDAGKYDVYYRIVDSNNNVVIPEDSVVVIVKKAESTLQVAQQTNLCIETSRNIGVTSNNTSGVSIINEDSSIANITTSNKTISVKGLSAGDTQVTVNIPEDKNHKANTTKINVTIENHDILGGQGTVITPSTCCTHGIAFHKCSKCGLDNKQVTERYSVELDPNNHEDYYDAIGYQKIPLHVQRDVEDGFPSWNGNYVGFLGGKPYLFWHYYLLNDEIDVYVPRTNILIAHYAGSQQHASGDELLFSAGWYYMSGYDYDAQHKGMDHIWQEYMVSPKMLQNDEEVCIYYMKNGTTPTMLKGYTWTKPRSEFMAGSAWDAFARECNKTISPPGENPSGLPWYDVWAWHKFKYRYCYACNGGLYLENLGFVPENG